MKHTDLISVESDSIGITYVLETQKKVSIT